MSNSARVQKAYKIRCSGAQPIGWVLKI